MTMILYIFLQNIVMTFFVDILIHNKNSKEQEKHLTLIFDTL